MTIEEDEPHPAPGSAGHTALAAAGEAVAFFAGAPIAGAGDAAAGLGDIVAEREAGIEDAIARRHAPDMPGVKRTPWIWLLIAGLVVIAALVWALKV